MGTPKTKKNKVTQPSLANFLLPASKPSQTVPSPLVMSEEDQEPQQEQQPQKEQEPLDEIPSQTPYTSEPSYRRPVRKLADECRKFRPEWKKL